MCLEVSGVEHMCLGVAMSGAYVYMWESVDELRCHSQGCCSLHLRKGLSLAWSLPIKLGWLANKSQAPSCLHFCNTGCVT